MCVCVCVHMYNPTDKVFQLPSYEESRNMSKDPPSYTQIFGPDSTLPETNISSFTSSLTLPPCGPPVYSLPTSSQPEATALSTSDDLPPQYTSQPIRNQLSSNCALAESGKYVYWLYDM